MEKKRKEKKERKKGEETKEKKRLFSSRRKTTCDSPLGLQVFTRGEIVPKSRNVFSLSSSTSEEMTMKKLFELWG